MAYSKVRWISMPAFLACVGGAHGKGEGTNVHQWAQMTEADVCAPRAGVCASEAATCAPQPAVCAPPTSVCVPPIAICAPQSSVCTPYVGICTPPPAYAPLNQPYVPAATPTIQRGNDVAATVDKVSPDLSCPRSTRC
jgi:hypothetical protein